MSSDNNNNRRRIKYPITRQQLARIYQIDKDVITAWLDDIGIRRYKKLTPLDVELIRKSYGEP